MLPMDKTLVPDDGIHGGQPILFSAEISSIKARAVA